MTRRWAKVSITPEAHWLRIIDLATGSQFKNVIEVDADAGWLIRVMVDESGLARTAGDEFMTERLDGLHLRIDIDRGIFGGKDGDWQEWNPQDTADGITEIHKHQIER